MADSLAVIPECRREHPLSVHGVVLFPAAPGGSVVHVDAAEYVRWLGTRVNTLRSQLALCRAALPADVQDAVDALNFGGGVTTNSDTTSVLSIPSRPSSVVDTDKRHTSAFTAIESRPSVFKPFGANTSNNDEIHDDNAKTKVPFLRRIFDRSHSSKNTGIGSDEASEIEPPSSNFDHPSSMARIGSEVTSGSGADTNTDTTRRRRRRSLSLDNFSRNLILVDSPVSTNTTPAQLYSSNNQPTPFTLSKLPRARTSTAVHRLTGSTTNNYMHPPKVLCPVAKRAHSNYRINNSISNNNISNDSYSACNISSQPSSSCGDGSEIDMHIDSDVEGGSESHFGGEPVDDDDECYSDGDSINPELATVASHLHLDADNNNINNNHDESESDIEIDSLSDFNPERMRSHSEGAALTDSGQNKHENYTAHLIMRNSSSKHGGERERRVATNLTKSSNYYGAPTSSIDSADRTTAAAEALARRTSIHKARRSFSMEHFKRDSGATDTNNTNNNNNSNSNGGDNVAVNTTNIFLSGMGRRTSLADHTASRKENNSNNNNNTGSWKEYLFGTRLGKRATFPRENSTHSTGSSSGMPRATSGKTSASERERSGTPFQPRVSIGSRSRSSVRSSWKNNNTADNTDDNNLKRKNSSRRDRVEENNNMNINMEISGDKNNNTTTNMTPGRGSIGHGKKGIKLASLFRFQSKYHPGRDGM